MTSNPSQVYKPIAITYHLKTIIDQLGHVPSSKILFKELKSQYGNIYSGRGEKTLLPQIESVVTFLDQNPDWVPPFSNLRQEVITQSIPTQRVPLQRTPVSSTEPSDALQKKAWDVKQAVARLRQLGIVDPTVDQIKEDLLARGSWRGADPTLVFVIKSSLRYLATHPDFTYIKGSSKVPTPAPTNKKEAIKETIRAYRSNEAEDSLNQFRWLVKQALRRLKEVGITKPTPQNIFDQMMEDGTVPPRLPKDAVIHSISIARDFLDLNPEFTYGAGSARIRASIQTGQPQTGQPQTGQPQKVPAQSSRVRPNDGTAPLNSELNNFRSQVKTAIQELLKKGDFEIISQNISRQLLEMGALPISGYNHQLMRRKIEEAMDYIETHPDFEYPGPVHPINPQVILAGSGKQNFPTFVLPGGHPSNAELLGKGAREPSSSHQLPQIRVRSEIIPPQNPVPAQEGDLGLTELGINKALPAIRDFVRTPLAHQDQYRFLGTLPSKSALIVMPDGLNPNLIVQVLAQKGIPDQTLTLYAVDGMDYMETGNLQGGLENALTEALETQPALIHLRNLDRLFEYLVGPASAGTKVKRMAEFQRFAHKIQTGTGLVLLMTTATTGHIPTQLKTPEYFSTQINISLPDTESRGGMYLGLIRTRRVHPNVLAPTALTQIISHTPGYTRADMILLFDTASRLAIERGGNPEELAIDLTDIQRAIKQIKPLAVQTGLSTIPNISWNDLGGLFEIKQEIFSSMMYPLKYPDVYKQFGIPQSSGIMLHGPPGTGKTMIAKAAANDASANFIAVKPSDIFGKYLGQSENNVRDLFARAATLAPCIIFFDEFESIGSIRGGEGGSANRGREVVITQLLVEMDGIENRAGVFLLAATNRLDAVDPAFLRPGRFDKRIYVGLPNRKERASILEVAITSIRSNGVQIGWPNLKELARQTDGFSAADLTMLVREAASLAAHQMIERMDQSGVQLQPQIDAANFAQALRKLRPSSEIRQGSPSRQASTSAGPGYYM